MIGTTLLLLVHFGFLMIIVVCASNVKLLLLFLIGVIIAEDGINFMYTIFNFVAGIYFVEIVVHLNGDLIFLIQLTLLKFVNFVMKA